MPAEMIYKRMVDFGFCGQSDLQDYAFLKDNKYLGENLILVGLGGSHSYGTNTEDSDLDIRGSAVNSKGYILSGRDFEQVVDKKTDTTIYSFDKTVKLLLACNPNVIEILGLKPEHYLYVSDIGQILLNNRKMFLSKRVVYTFGGYANAQLRRLENKAARIADQSLMEKHILGSIENASHVFAEKYASMDKDALKLYIDKSENPDFDTEIFMDIRLAHYPLRDFCGLYSEMSSIVRQYGKIGHRNENAIMHNKIGKHMMHLVRLYLMCFDILERGEIITYREKEHDFLMDIRNGKYLNDEGQPVKEFFDIITEYEERLKYLGKHSCLPDHPDLELFYEFVADINHSVVARGESI